MPSQLGLHFWPNFSSVLGVRVDYLSPTISVTDILIGLLFIIVLVKFIVQLKKNQQRNIKYFKPKSSDKIIYFIFVISLLIGVIFSKSPLAGWYGFLKLLEFLFLGFYIAKSSIRFGKIIFLLIPGFVIESVLAILQTFHHGSLGGVWYFLGERSFSSQTPGIANATIAGQLVLRPYATFPHPNVLAGYLLIVLSLFSFFLLAKQKPSRLENRAMVIIIAFGAIALSATLSRIAIVLWLLVIGIVAVLKIKTIRINPKIVIISIPIVLLILWTPGSVLVKRFLETNLSEISLIDRLELSYAAVSMTRDHLLLGVGLNNFLVNLPQYYPTHRFFALQPVHNIYLYILAETGLVGFGSILWFVIKTLKQQQLKKVFSIEKIKPQQGFFVALFLILVLGLFDHYFITLQQGRLLLCLVLGLCWRKKNTL